MKKKSVTHGLQDDGTFIIDDRERQSWLERSLALWRRVDAEEAERASETNLPDTVRSRHP
jgi:hypothetical protein